MVIVLFALGIVAVLAGLGMIGYGVPNYEFGLGNLLIGSGVTAILGGFIIICLAVGVAQLQRIAALLRALPAPRVGAEPGRPRPAPGARPPMARPGAEAPARTPAPPAPLPARPLEARHAEPRQPEPPPPPPPIAPAAEAPVEVQVERPRPRFLSRPEPQSEPPLVEETEEVTLSPRTAPRPYASPLQRDLDFVPEPPRREADTSPSPNGTGPAFASPRAEPPRAEPPRAEPPWRSSTPPRFEPRPDPTSERVVERNMFAGLWETRSEPVAPEHEATAPASDEEPVAPPVAAAKPPQPEPAEPRPVSVLKSGVVDGMAYTLYSDGSIEAELPEGTVRFSSINELRQHLEKHEELEQHS